MPKGPPIDEDVNTEVVELNMGDVKITFLDPTGKPLKRGGEARRFMFDVEGPGIDPLRVRRVIIPPLDYSCSDMLTIKVEMYTGDLGLGEPCEEKTPTDS
jgi:hypothetical protein